MKTEFSHGLNTDETPILRGQKLGTVVDFCPCSICVSSVAKNFVLFGTRCRIACGNPFVISCFRDPFMHWSFGFGIVGWRSWLVVVESFGRKLRHPFDSRTRSGPCGERACYMGRQNGQGCKSTFTLSQRELLVFFERIAVF